MADPGPVAQTFFLDDDFKTQFLLDAIVTVVDCRHIEQHLDQMDEPGEQVAFADVILLNKTDLVTLAELERIERRVRAINGTARIHRTQNADIAVDQVLDVGAFDLDRALAVDSAFLEPQYPFEWAGVYSLQPGSYQLRTGAEEHAAHEHGDHGHDHHDHDHDHDHGDDHDGHDDHGEAAHDHEGAEEPATHEAHGDHDADDEHHGHDHGDGLGIVLIPATAATSDALAAQIEPAVRAFSEDPATIDCGGTLAPAPGLQRIDVAHDGTHFTLEIGRAGAYALFCEHAPAEFNLRIEGQAPVAQRAFASHHHDEEIFSIGITDPRPLDANKVNDWLSYLLQSRGADIFRMKGVLNIRAEERRYVFHGVHMMFDGQLERPWRDTVRHSSLVFIGRNLDRAELEAGFESCVAR
jgi:G3E family GTPase